MRIEKQFDMMGGLSKRIVGKKTPIVIICTLLCVFQSFALFQADTTIGSGVIVRLSFFLQFALAVILVVRHSKDFHLNNSNLFILVSIFFWWLLESVLHYYKGIALFSIVSPFILATYVLLSDHSKALAYKAFYNVFWGVSLLGIIAYLLYVLNVLPPFSVVDFYEADSLAQYANYGFAYVLKVNAAVGFDRLCGLFNEPGYLGTVGAFVLMIEDLKINFKNVVIFIACVMSFSMAFFALLCVYILLKLLFTRDIKLMIVVFLLVLVYIYLSTKEIVNDDLARFINRFVLNDGRFGGDTRVGSIDAIIWERVLNNPSMLWFGYGKEYDFEGSSYQSLIIKHGIVGTVAMLMPLIIGAIKIAKNNRSSLVLIICFFLSMYQRPQIFNVPFFTILLGGMQYMKRKNSLTIDSGIK